MGGWSEVKALRRIGGRELSDERILGSGEFVKRVSEEVELARRYRFTAYDRIEKVRKAIETACSKHQIEIDALKNGSRLGPVSRARAVLSLQLVNEYGLSLAETARKPGVSTSAVAKTIKLRQDRLSK